MKKRKEVEQPWDTPPQGLAEHAASVESRESVESSGPVDRAESTEPDDPRLEKASTKYVGTWNRLVSTTNWEKGRIIQAWRMEMIALGAPGSLHSDEAWSQRVGGVSSQHVGRLRRVFERFGSVRGQYEGLYWSHFQAALDWDDAEMWLEGATANRWSVAAMRQKRAETLGAVAEAEPTDVDLAGDGLDEDAAGALDALPEVVFESPAVVEPAQWDAGAEEANDRLLEASAAEEAVGGESAAEPVRPFEHLPELPDDLADAVEALKLAIVRHKLAGWRDVRAEDVLATLGALGQLVQAPAG